MSWLLREGDVLAALDDRRPGWARSLRGAVVLNGPTVVHTIRCPLALDLAFCGWLAGVGGETCLEVRRIASLGPHRVARPQLRRGVIVAAAEGAFERWQLRVGDHLEIKRA